MSVKVSPGETTEPLSPKQQAFILILCSGISIVTAAKSVGIAEKTAHKWLKLPHFLAAYKQAQHDIFTESLCLLMTGIEDAIGGIKSIAKDSEIVASVRLRAYQIWLEQSVAINKVSELEQKIQELEQKIAATRE